jgi:hypothetical protein
LKRQALIVLALALLGAHLFADVKITDGVTYNRKTNQYDIIHEVDTILDSDKLLPVFYAKDHLVHYYRSFHKIENIVYDESRYKVIFHYKRTFFEWVTYYDREIDRDAKRVTFNLVSQEQNVRILPEIVYSRGYFEVIPGDKKNRIVYRQEVQFKGFGNAIQRAVFIKNINDFFDSIDKYIRRLEKAYIAQKNSSAPENPTM